MRSDCPAGARRKPRQAADAVAAGATRAKPRAKTDQQAGDDQRQPMGGEDRLGGAPQSARGQRRDDEADDQRPAPRRLGAVDFERAADDPGRAQNSAEAEDQQRRRQSDQRARKAGTQAFARKHQRRHEQAEAERRQARLAERGGERDDLGDERAPRRRDAEEGRRLADYFANKLGCGEIHMGYWKEVAQAEIDGAGAGNDSQARAAVVPHARLMLDYARQYLRAYQQCMLDRTDEGMLASYWIVAGQYAYRYAFPQQHEEGSIFYDGPPKASKPTADRPEEIQVLAPR